MKISCCTQARSHPLLNPVKTVLCAEMIHNKQLYCLSTLLYENFFQGFFFSPFNKELPVLVGTSPCPQSGSDTSPGLVKPSGRISNQLHFPETGATSSIQMLLRRRKKKNTIHPPSVVTKARKLTMHRRSPSPRNNAAARWCQALKTRRDDP